MIRLLITTAQLGAKVNERFFKNLKRIVKKENIDTVYIFVVKGRTISDIRLDRKLEETLKIGDADVRIIMRTPRIGFRLNNNLRLFHTQIRPQNIKPFWGLQPKLSRQYSFIVNGTKVRFEVVGTVNKPRTLTSTGAITKPYYRENTATGTKGREMHTFGFTFVEIKNDKKFKIRPIIANQNGDFTFGKTKYRNGKTFKEKTKAIILGDIHRAVIDKEAFRQSIEMTHYYSPKYIIIHDLTDMMSINYHTVKEFLSQINRSNSNYDSIEKELKKDAKFITERLAHEFPNKTILIVESNHDEFIRKYINMKLFLKDPQNILFISRMLDTIINSKNKTILQIALENTGWKVPSNVKFLSHIKEFRIGGKLVSYHGHKGITGSRGTPHSYEKNNIKAVTGHTHSPQLYSNGGVVGHLTNTKKQKYAEGGISKWLQANIVIDSLNKLHMLVLDSNF